MLCPSIIACGVVQVLAKMMENASGGVENSSTPALKSLTYEEEDEETMSMDAKSLGTTWGELIGANNIRVKVIIHLVFQNN